MLRILFVEIGGECYEKQSCICLFMFSLYLFEKQTYLCLILSDIHPIQFCAHYKGKLTNSVNFLKHLDTTLICMT